MKSYYQDKWVTIYHGDCREILPVLDCKVDLVLTSPPYDNLRDYGGQTFDYISTIETIVPVIKKGGVCVWIVGDATQNGSESCTSFRQALKFIDCGLSLHDTMIYEKNGPPYPSKDKYYQTFEYMFVFSKGKPSTVNLITDRKNKWVGQKWSSGRTRRTIDGELKRQDWYVGSQNDYGVRFNIWRYHTGAGYSTKDKVAFEHPATFPELLAQDHIISWSNPNEIILDPMVGSGTVLKNCKKLNRHSIGIEIEERYCEIAANRCRQEVMELGI